jgi:hypothetical protein
MTVMTAGATTTTTAMIAGEATGTIAGDAITTTGAEGAGGTEVVTATK